jgi:ketosteroid isomerase-like protein
MKYISIILITVLLSCQNSVNTMSAKEDILKVLMSQQNAWNEGDIDGYMQGYLKSDSLRFASGGNVSYGWQNTFERYAAGYPDRNTMGLLTFSEIDISIISDDSALAFGKWELERSSDHPWGLFTLILKKTPEGWRIVHDHTSSAK